MTNNIDNNLSITGRGARVILSIGLITATIAGDGSLGAFATIPLLAIYPGITGLLGYDPLTRLLSRVLHRNNGERILLPAAHAT